MEQRKFYEAKSHLSEFYGIDLDNDVFETYALHAWDKINNKIYRFYTYTGRVKNFKLELPCNADIIESIQVSGESVGTTNAVADNYAYNESSLIEEHIENRRYNSSPYYSRGHYIDHERSGNSLIFKRDNFNVSVLYKGIITDEEGLPSLNYKEIEAIAKYCVYVDTFKKAMMTKDQSTMQISQLLKQEWLIACADARTPIFITQNDMDKILDVQSSWDRKRFGKSYKILR